MAPSSAPMCWGEIPYATQTQVASDCQVYVEKIQDAYRCTPLQLAMIASKRCELFHFILSFGPTADIDRFCAALAYVVAQNAILRTRIVDVGALGILQVVVDEVHKTHRQLDGKVENYLLDSQHNDLAMHLGAPLFRTAFIGRVFVATIHHAIMDYWSMTTLMNVDVAKAYYGQPLLSRPPFKDFVAYSTNIHEGAARSFWASRFRGVSSVFPKVARDEMIVASAKPSRKIALGNQACIPSPSHMPYYLEAAWALISAAYLCNDSVAYGLVLSGRSSALQGLEETLGPTIVEVPIQANILRNGTVDRLIKDRATSLRQLQSQPAIRYDVDKIATVSEPAKAASAFTTLLNIRPSMPFIAEDEDVKFERMIWLRGSFPLQLVCSIMEDGVMIEPRCDASVIPYYQLHRILGNLEHVLRKLVLAPAQTIINEMDLLSADDRLELSELSTKVTTMRSPEVLDVFQSLLKSHHHATPPLDDTDNIKIGSVNMMGDSPSTTIPPGVALWLVNPQTLRELVPIGSIGEILMEIPKKCNSYAFDESKSLVQPHWATGRGGQESLFFRTGYLAQFNPEGIIRCVGEVRNRVKVGGVMIQLEEVEQIICKSGIVRECIVCAKIITGRTRLIAVVSLGERGTSGKRSLQTVTDSTVGSAHDKIAAIRRYASAKLNTQMVPDFWHVVEALPRTSYHRLDRGVVRQWLDTSPQAL